MLSEKWVVLDYNAILTDCIQTSDGGFAAIGCGVSESFLLKLDANFDVEWMKSWPIGGAPSGDLIRNTFASITQLASGNYYISGAYYPTLVGTVYENLVVVTDNNGNLLSAKSISQGTSTQETVKKTIELPDGRIMSLGNVITSGTASNISVFHDNAAGVTACTATTLSIATTASGVLFDKDKSLISPIVYTAVISKDTLVIKTSYNQTTICPPLDMGLKAEAGSIKIYPNPVSEKLLISLPDQDFEMNYELFITGIEGRLILKKTLIEISSEVNVKLWPAGLYTYRLQSADGSQVNGIFVKQ
ncbi:MAG: T9SS type A sorting domain-containing protein, partial [Chitinophagales bacterium]